MSKHFSLGCIYAILAATFVVLFSCKYPNSHSKAKSSSVASWKAIYMYTDSQMMGIFPESDTLMIRHIEIPERDVIKVDNFFISSAEKDSMMLWCSELLNTEPRDSLPYCTDYVGNFKVYVYYSEQIKKNVQFSSICDWRTLNVYTRKIDKLVTEKLQAK